ncbi:MAG TPA: tripartite tricarboxylate transporter substrate-binding protein, partial [Beijerinckiaceae bacterium]
MHRRGFLTLASAGAAAALAGGARAQTYPDRPIRLIVPFPPGGVNDAVARPWAEKVKTSLGSVVIENQGGAGGAIGATSAARAQPDGYTLLFGSGATHIVIPAASARPPFDPDKDFEPISIISVSGIGIAVHPSHPAKTLKELIDAAR